MKITTRIDPITDETIIEIRTKQKERAETMLTLLSSYDGFFMGSLKEKTYKIPFFDVFYFSFDEEKTYIFTKSHRFETHYRLYEIPLISNQFLRVHKSYVVNIYHIASFQNSAHGRMELTLNNGDRLMVSRSYVESMKVQLGGLK
jgi:DNA-binding LytR/AlgR family response regulator